MKILITVIAASVGLFLFFIVAPAVTCFFSVFTRKKGTPVEEMSENNYYSQHKEQIKKSWDKLTVGNHKTVTVKSFDGLKLTAEYYDVGGDITLILMPGYNTVPLNNYAYIGDFLTDNGYNLLIPNNRAHEGSEGKYPTLGINESRDLLSFISFIEATSCKAIGIYGVSMGCTALGYASDKLSDKVKCLVFDCGYVSPYEEILEAMRRYHLPARQLLFIGRILGKKVLKVDIKQDARDNMKNAKLPALFIHGKEDHVVKLATQGKRMYEAYGGQKESFYVDGADHTASMLVSKELGKEKLLSFLRENLGD